MLLKYNSCTVKRLKSWSAVLSFSSHICLCNLYPITIQNTAITPRYLSAASMSTPSISHPTPQAATALIYLFIFCWWRNPPHGISLYLASFTQRTAIETHPVSGVSEMIFFLKFFIDEVFLVWKDSLCLVILLLMDIWVDSRLLLFLLVKPGLGKEEQAEMYFSS